jgi:hypothetical protein
LTEKRDHPARAEQPGAGGFEEGQQTLPDDEHVGKFSEGNETLPDDEHVGKFSEGNETPPHEEHEGKFSDSAEANDREPPSNHGHHEAPSPQSERKEHDGNP